MRKTAFFMAIMMGLCLLSACGAETASDSVAVTEETAESTQESGKLTLPAVSMQVPDRKITAVSFTYSRQEPLVLDIGEKTGSFAAHAESEVDVILASQIQIYAEDETLVEISDITVKDGGLVNFYLTGKKAGNSKLYIAAADGSLVSEPLEFEVRSEEEKTYAQQAVYYSSLGDYWHLSEECAKSDGPDTFYNYKGEELSDHAFDFPIIQTTRENLLGVGDRTPCPKCAAEESSQQDGE